MSLSRTAIRYELSGASVGMLFRLCLRIQLFWIVVWTASDVFFVGYWTGRMSGPGAHEYFGRWILAWFFTQKVPLYFLSLPYRGGRATIGSMYTYLNWRLYSGRSFGEWSVFYSRWSVLPGSWTVGEIAYLLVHDPANRPEGRQLRGLRLIPPRRLARELRHTALAGDCRGVNLAEVNIRVHWNASIS